MVEEIVRSNDEHLTFEEWITADTWVDYAVCAR
jgi:hypothetical protein